MSEAPDETTQEQDGPEPDAPITPEQAAEEEEGAAEAEEVEGAGGEPEQESAPEASGAAGAVGEKELEKMFRKVDAANLAYLKRLEGIMESEIGVLEPCPRCSDPFLGLIFPPMMKPVTAEVRDAVLASVGEQPAQATLQTKYARRCEDCDDNGVVLTGSRTNRDKAIKCPECNGRGWIPVGDELRVGRPDVAPAAQGNGEPTTVPITLAPSEPAPDTDLWGRKVGDPDYGVHPMYVASR